MTPGLFCCWYCTNFYLKSFRFLQYFHSATAVPPWFSVQSSHFQLNLSNITWGMTGGPDDQQKWFTGQIMSLISILRSTSGFTDSQNHCSVDLIKIPTLGGKTATVSASLKSFMFVEKVEFTGSSKVIFCRLRSRFFTEKTIIESRRLIASVSIFVFQGNKLNVDRPCLKFYSDFILRSFA